MTMGDTTMNERSDAFWEGYRTTKHKGQNPYAVGQPWLAEFPDKPILVKMKDWTDGWEAHYYKFDVV